MHDKPAFLQDRALDSLRWDDLKILLAIGRLGSLTGAAQLLGIDQTTAGRRLSALEADLGALLFVRSKAGFAPTEIGGIALSHALRIEHETEKLKDVAADPDTGATGMVRLVGNAWTLNQLLGHSSADFLAKNPNLTLRCVTLTPQNITRGEATLSLWFERKKTENEFIIDLGHVPYAVYHHKNIDKANKNWVAFFDEDFDRPMIAGALKGLQKQGENVQMTATDASLLITSVCAGTGRGLLPMCLAENHPDLVRDTSGPPEFLRMLRLHLHPDNLNTKRMQATIQWIRDSFDTCFSGVS